MAPKITQGAVAGVLSESIACLTCFKRSRTKEQIQWIETVKRRQALLAWPTTVHVVALVALFLESFSLAAVVTALSSANYPLRYCCAGVCSTSIVASSIFETQQIECTANGSRARTVGDADAGILGGVAATLWCLRFLYITVRTARWHRRADGVTCLDEDGGLLARMWRADVYGTTYASMVCYSACAAAFFSWVSALAATAKGVTGAATSIMFAVAAAGTVASVLRAMLWRRVARREAAVLEALPSLPSRPRGTPYPGSAVLNYLYELRVIFFACFCCFFFFPWDSMDPPSHSDSPREETPSSEWAAAVESTGAAKGDGGAPAEVSIPVGAPGAGLHVRAVSGGPSTQSTTEGTPAAITVTNPLRSGTAAGAAAATSPSQKPSSSLARGEVSSVGEAATPSQTGGQRTALITALPVDSLPSTDRLDAISEHVRDSGLAAVAAGAAEVLGAVAPALPLIGLAFVPLTLALRQAQRMQANSTEAAEVTARLERLRALLTPLERDSEFQRSNEALCKPLAAVMDSLVSKLQEIADRTSVSKFLMAGADKAALTALQEQLDACLSDFNTALAVYHAGQGGRILDALQAGQAELVGQVAAAVASATASKPPVLPPPPFSMSLRISDFLFDPPLAEQRLTAPRGTFGSVVFGVWKSQSAHLPVAVKLVPAIRDGIHIGLDAWLSEAENMRRVREGRGGGLPPSHVVLLYGIGAVTGDKGLTNEYLVVMERMENGGLDGLLRDKYARAGRQPSLSLALQWIGDIARGIAECHAVNVVHGDVKSANVLVSDRNVAKLGDLGAARVTRNMSGTATHTRGGPSMGTGSLLWLAPEMLDDGTLLPQCASDVYSWAVTAWEILTLRLPYHDAEGVPTVNLAKHSTLTGLITGSIRPDLSVLRVDTPPPLVALMQRAWAPTPAERPAIGDVLKELQAIVAALL